WTETFYEVTVTYVPTATSSEPIAGGESASLTVPGGGGEGVTFDARYALMSNGNCENPGDAAVWVARAAN
ncbi:MAG TPA: hypothetical protein VL400_25265, partial [Polyangiaceae bacterium]|nr:hypothetical protein [Polyangiaceae bacterium]